MIPDPNIAHEVAEAIRHKSPLRSVEIDPETRLIDDLGLDSLRVLELLVDFEDRYGLAPFGEGEMMGVVTVGALVATVISRVRQTRRDSA